MTNWKRISIFFFCAFFFAVAAIGQNSLSAGPILSIGKSEPGVKDGRGLGGSVEFYHRFFSNSGLRVAGGFEEFHRPGAFNDEVSYTSIRGGYQHWMAKDRLHFWGDAGIARLEYASGGGYNLFTFSAGGGYAVPLSNKSFLQFQAFYVYTDNKEPFDNDDHYGWVTFRAAYGFRFGK